MAKQKVDDTLQLLQDHKYMRLDYDKKKVFFYKQVNPEVGALVCYANAKNKFGNENKHYDLHCFDLFLHIATNVTFAVHQNLHHGNKVMDFWIPSLNPYNEMHVHVLDVLDKEECTQFDLLNEKYKTLIGQTK